jgi:hypothetical protein
MARVASLVKRAAAAPRHRDVELRAVGAGQDADKKC